MGRGQQGSAPAPRSAWVPANPVDLDRGRAGRRSVAARLTDASGGRAAPALRAVHEAEHQRQHGEQVLAELKADITLLDERDIDHPKAACRLMASRR